MQVIVSQFQIQIHFGLWGLDILFNATGNTISIFSLNVSIDTYVYVNLSIFSENNNKHAK